MSRIPESSSTHAANGSFTILYFAAAQSYTSLSSEMFPAPLPLSKLFSTLESRYPGITNKVLKSCAVTVNLEYVDLEKANSVRTAASADTATEAYVIQSGDEVGIIPPVSSG